MKKRSPKIRINWKCKKCGEYVKPFGGLNEPGKEFVCICPNCGHSYAEPEKPK
jgi:hypothetical protein